MTRVSARPPSTGRVADERAIFHGKAHTVGGQTGAQSGRNQWRVIATSRRSGNQDDGRVCRGNRLSQRRGGRSPASDRQIARRPRSGPGRPRRWPTSVPIGDPGADEQPGDVSAAELARHLSRRREHFPGDGTRSTRRPQPRRRRGRSRFPAPTSSVTARAGRALQVKSASALATSATSCLAASAAETSCTFTIVPETVFAGTCGASQARRRSAGALAATVSTGFFFAAMIPFRDGNLGWSSPVDESRTAGNVERTV